MHDIILVYNPNNHNLKEIPMLDFLFKKETVNSCDNLNSVYSKLKEMYSFDSISDERKEY